MKKEIKREPCKCGCEDKVWESSYIKGMLFGYIIGCNNSNCRVGAAVGIGLTSNSARRKAIKQWNKMVSR